MFLSAVDLRLYGLFHVCVSLANECNYCNKCRFRDASAIKARGIAGIIAAKITCTIVGIIAAKKTCTIVGIIVL